MISTKNNKFSNGFRWAWKFSLFMFLISLGLIVLGVVGNSPGDLKQGINGIVMLPANFFIAYILGFFFAKDITNN
jgi:hypothetical protein